jgi:thymidine phosphorylase
MKLRPIPMGIDTYHELVLYMRRDCPICLSEGFTASTRLLVASGDRQVIATLNVVDPSKLDEDCVGLSDALWQMLHPDDGISVSHAPVVTSMSDVRAKMYDRRLSEEALKRIITDIAQGWYSDVQISAFLASCAGDRLDRNEVAGLTRAMIEIGERLTWPGIDAVYDKHCIGGLPGNRTTPIVVAVCSAAGLILPKTSSRAITSPAGTADVMDVLTRVDLDIDDIRRTVELVGGCLAWGGAVRLSPVDDLLIRVERALDLDSKGQLVASVLSKKVAAGSTHILIDIPVGKTAKVRDTADGESLAALFRHVGEHLGVYIECVFTDGSQPIGRGIGPALEARDVLAVLRNEAAAPIDLREKSLDLCAHLLAMANHGDAVAARVRASELLDSGAAWQQFERICQAQGRFSAIPEAPYSKVLQAHQQGLVSDIDNRRIARLAKLAGAPRAISAGLELFVHLGDRINRGDPLLAIHAESEGELDYALLYYLDNRDMIRVGESP